MASQVTVTAIKKRGKNREKDCVKEKVSRKKYRIEMERGRKEWKR
jgi:hypothetical protein